MQNSRVKSKLRNSIIASKIMFENPSEEIRSQVVQQLSIVNTTVYHMDSLWRNNDNDKYELFRYNKEKINENILKNRAKRKLTIVKNKRNSVKIKIFHVMIFI